MRPKLMILWLPKLTLAVVGCGSGALDVYGPPGAPLPDLDSQQLELFRQGEAIFRQIFGPEEGLGPAFNETSCFGCHDIPSSGGTGVEEVLMATRWVQEEAACEDYGHLGGPIVRLRHIRDPGSPSSGPDEDGRLPRVPPAASEVTYITAPLLYGLGLVETVPEETILALAAAPGGTGRAIVGSDGRLGRFGRKAQHPDLSSFTAAALLHEMGLTSPLHPRDPLDPSATPSPGGEASYPAMARTDVEMELVESLALYIRFLAVPERGPPREPGREQVVARGALLFRSVGCSRCHLPELQTGVHEVTALNMKVVPLYSDLLVHDLGPESAGVCSGATSPTEWRTAPLMGLRHRLSLMHDGRAPRLEEAIRLHGGAAAQEREAFQNLPVPDQDALFQFLDTL